MFISASIPWKCPNFFCFDPAMVLFHMEEVFGTDFAYDYNDLFDGHYERIVESATTLGIPLDRPVVKEAARHVRELSPRYKFRLRTGPDVWVEGKVDRYTIFVMTEDKVGFPDPMRSRFLEFLQSLQSGLVKVLVSEG